MHIGIFLEALKQKMMLDPSRMGPRHQYFFKVPVLALISSHKPAVKGLQSYKKGSAEVRGQELVDELISLVTELSPAPTVLE